MRIAIIGAGPAGLAAAYDLNKAGYDVTIFEGGPRVGGLAGGFKDENWEWELEKYYHHWFQSDHDILDLIAELGLSDKVIFRRPKTTIWSQGKVYPFDNTIAWLTFPHLPLIPKMRFGFTGIYLRYTKNWKPMEKFSAQDWLTRYMGKSAYDILWKPLLIGKFGDLYDQVTMAWMWSRLYTRSVKLGTFEGGFQHFLDIFAQKLQTSGVKICLNSGVQGARQDGLLWRVKVNDQEMEYDAVISTTSPSAMLRLVPELSGPYADKLRALKHMGAVVLVLALKQQFLTDNSYWVNIPATSADKSKSEFPFLGLFEHTNYMDAVHYGGDHILYCGDYVPVDHEYFKLSDDQLADRFLAALPHFNANFNRDWIRKQWVFRAPYAQPIPLVNHSQNIPDLATTLPGLYLASMSQIYPYDRGTNYAVQIGRQVAARVVADQHTARP